MSDQRDSARRVACLTSSGGGPEHRDPSQQHHPLSRQRTPSSSPALSDTADGQRTARPRHQRNTPQDLSYTPTRSHHTPQHSPTGSMTTDADPTATYAFESKSLYRDSFRCLYDFYQNGTLSDVEIVCGNKSVKCHRVVLACASTYFKTMFTSEMSECHKFSIHIKDVDEAALMQLIQFAYTARVVINIENVQGLLYAASILQVETVASACCEFMKTHLHPTNCIGIRSFAELPRSDGANHSGWPVHPRPLHGGGGERRVPHDVAQTPRGSHRLARPQRQHRDTGLRGTHQVDQTWHRPAQTISIQTTGPCQSLALLPPTYLLDTVSSEELIKNEFSCRDFLDRAKDYQLSLANVIPDFKLSDKILPRKSCAGECSNFLIFL